MSRTYWQDPGPFAIQNHAEDLIGRVEARAERWPYHHERLELGHFENIHMAAVHPTAHRRASLRTGQHDVHVR